MAYITRNSSPTSDATYPDLAAALATLDGATHVRDNLYSLRGYTYEICEGDNPNAARRAARSAVASPYRHRIVSVSGLSREMDRADSDY